jgi:hypothetical protein
MAPPYADWFSRAIRLINPQIVRMHTAWVLFNHDPGSEEEIIREPKKLPGSVEVSRAYSVYDIAVKKR